MGVGSGPKWFWVSAFRVGGLRRHSAAARPSISINRAFVRHSMSNGRPSVTDVLCVSMTHTQAFRPTCLIIEDLYNLVNVR